METQIERERDKDLIWRDNISTKVKRIETFFYLVAIPFAAILASHIWTGYLNPSQQVGPNISPIASHVEISDASVARELQDALLSLKEIKDSINDLRVTQAGLMAKIKEDKKSTDFVEGSIPQSSPTELQDEMKQEEKNEKKRNTKFLYPKAAAQFFEDKKANEKRQLQDATETGCSGTLFRLELSLDLYPSETVWELIGLDGVSNRTYVDGEDDFTTDIYESCITPGPYEFVLYDLYGDGISCESEDLSCYSIYIDNELVIKGNLFESRDVSHAFDSSSLCLLTSAVHIQNSFADASNITIDLVNTRTLESLELLPDDNGGLYACVQADVFSLTFTNTYAFNTACNGADTCYNVVIGGNEVLNGTDFLDEVNRVFFVARDGFASEKSCSQLPILSPINDFSSYNYNERVGRALNVIHALSSLGDIYTKNSVQYRATCFVLYDDVLQISPESSQLVQRYALAVLFFSLNLDAEVELGLNSCESDFIFCEETSAIVRGIKYNKSPLGGSIPTEIAHLENLERLDLRENELQGIIPSDITRMKKLKTVRLDDNNLIGSIPSLIGDLKNMEMLTLRKNKITGSIPNEIGRLAPSLKFLTVNENELSGTLPSSLFDCELLQIVAINANHLSGTIPPTFGNLQDLFILNAENNLLSGTIPSELGNLFYLITFDVGNNRLSGTIPPELGNVLFNELRLNNNFLTGTVPDLLIEDKVYLNKNLLTGDIPDSFWAQRNISGYKFNDNSLVGYVPDDLCDTLPEVPGYEGMNVYDLSMDDSPWFENPKVTCECCDDVNCHLWSNAEVIIVGGTRRPACPVKNLQTFRVYERYIFTDLTANVTHGEGIGTGIAKDLEFCLSPTGCYNVLQELEDGKDDQALTWDLSYRLGYSDVSRTLEEQETCDAVNVCGQGFAFDDPKRMGINHLTHMVLDDLTVFDNPSSAHNKALCWLLTEDDLFFDYGICDGTLLQRYIMALFYYTYIESFDFETLPVLPTCEWPGIVCDSEKGKYVEEINLGSQGIKGSLITEIGLLTRLRTLNLRDNAISGALDPVIFAYLPYLENFNFGSNKFGGELPTAMFTLPSLKRYNMSSNLLVGEIPNSIDYPRTLENFNVGNNLFYNFIPDKLLECKNLRTIDLSKNNLKGGISPVFGTLKDLKTLRLNENILSGSIPAELLELTGLEILELNSNDLTGILPSSLGDLENATKITLNHNSLKGPIPASIEKLTKLEMLHLHVNTLTGQAPSLPHLREQGENKYITDCGSPFFHLLNSISCETCTMCCNSDEMCQENLIWDIPIEGSASIVTFAVPLGVAFFFVLVYFASKAIKALEDKHDPLLIVDEDSTYCLYFSNSYAAYFIYAITIAGQACFYGTFLLASSFTHTSSDWQFSIICPSTSNFCKETNTVDRFGWFLFFVVTLATLGVDFVNSSLQMKKAASQCDGQLFVSGFLHFALSTLALFTSGYYNLATAPANTDLIVNAVILLFINDLDEQIMNTLQAMFPTWVDDRIDEVRANMEKRGTSDDNDSVDFGKTDMFE